VTLVNAETGEVLTPEVVGEDDYLENLAGVIRAQHRRSREALGEAVDAYFAIGEALLQARKSLPSDNEFGAWFRAQEFGFNRQWAHVLRTAAEHEAEVRLAVSSQLATGKDPNIEKAVKQARAAFGGGRDERPGLKVISGGDEHADEPVPDVFSAIVIDPPWRYDNVATRGAAEDHYPTMSLDELAAMELPAADNAHLYLWVTNGFLREGFGLVDAWGFTYKTILTWCKPQIGMGNWFRNTTEHVLFGVRGRHPTLRNDVPTHFTAPRTRHSAKPESFYDLVESCSPGPWVDMFSRNRGRFGWHTWGNEA
jgi:N6-adenosine-specific RNA methylase IME4